MSILCVFAGSSVHATGELSPLEGVSTGSILIFDDIAEVQENTFYSSVYLYLPPSQIQLEIIANTYQSSAGISHTTYKTIQLKVENVAGVQESVDILDKTFEADINLFKGVVVKDSDQNNSTETLDESSHIAKTINENSDKSDEARVDSVLVKGDDLDLTLVDNLEEIPEERPQEEILISSDKQEDEQLEQAIKEVGFEDPHDDLLVYYDENSNQVIEGDFEQSAVLIEDKSLIEINEADAIEPLEPEGEEEANASQDQEAESASEEGEEAQSEYSPLIKAYIKAYREGKHNEDKFIFSIYDESQETMEQALLEFEKPSVQALASTQDQSTNENPYMEGEFVIKFKSEWPHGLEGCAHCILAGGEKFQHYLADGSSSVDELNRICKITDARSVFSQRHQMSTAEAIFRDKKKFEDVKEKFSKRSKRIPKNYEPPDMTNTYIFKLEEDHDIEKVCEIYEADPHVEYAHPNYIVEKTVFPQDPPNDTIYQSLLYGLNNTGQTGGTADADIDAPEAWQIELGDGIIVAIVDTGVDWDHNDIDDNIWSNTDELINGVDSDSNGFIDDIRGWDFTECEFIIFSSCINPKPADNDPDDPIDGHGTHVGGTVGAIGNNATASIGVAPNVQIMPLKGLSDSGTGSTTWLADAITYAANNGADVISNSWGCGCPGGCMSATVETAIQAAFALGSVIVFSAGNDTCDMDNDSPQNMTETIAVSATDHNDAIASFSNFGDKIDVAAPGVTVYSLFPNDNITPLSGTSMSAPHVSGLAALILGKNPTLTNTQVRSVLRGTADDKGAAGFDVIFGAGRINAFNAVNLTGVAPVLSSVGNKITNTNQNIMFNITATDPNMDTITMTATLAGGAAVSTIGGTFTDNGGGNATFTWTPTMGQAGLDPMVTFTSTDSPDGFIDSETITITVLATGATCGNSIIEPPEECDDGNTVSGDFCSAVCLNESCGNSRIEPDTETCDDGNTAPNDGCSSTCQIEVCGDSLINNVPLEECDDGNTISGDGCDSNCIDEFCGDDKVNDSPNEQCDDGNMISLDGCSATCQLEFTCGNSILEPSEECDDGNLIAGDGCSPFCKNEICGNSIVDVGEECDDGNTISGDGCTSDCQIEDAAFCGDGVCNVAASETCANCRADCGSCRGLRPR